MSRDATSISWEEALRLLSSGDIVSVSQAHSLLVTLEDTRGQHYVTREPEIDAILRAVHALNPELSQRVSIGTE